MPTVLVTGASRGLGLEFCRQYAAQGWDVVACCRNPDKAPELSALAPKVRVEALDVDDDSAIAALARRVAGPLDVLINNAGVAGQEAGALNKLDSAGWLKVLRTNTISPVKMAEAFVEHLAAGGQRKLVAITSRLGSIELNDSGGMYAYRSSKAALNMAWKSLSLDLAGRGVICAVLHPGWVRTDMGGPSAPVTPPQSVAGMIKVIAGLTQADSGRFFDFDGHPLAW